MGHDTTPDTSPPSLARQEQLLAQAANNVERNQPPYEGVQISTRGELEWIMQHEGWGGTQDAYHVKYQLGPEGVVYMPADLRGANLSSVALGDIWLRMADLRQANLVYAGLRHAHLKDAQLQGADMGRADLEQAELSYADLSSAHLREALLLKADCSYVTLVDARLHRADLKGTILRGARLSSGTIISRSQLDTTTRFGDIIWDGAGLSRVDWSSAKRLGDEADIASATTRKERIDAEDLAVRTYRHLAIELQDQGITEPAIRYAYRAQVLQRRLFRRQFRIGNWLFSWALALLSGYGFRIRRILGSYLLIVVLCAVAYYLLGHSGYGPTLAPQEALLASITAFHGRVFTESFSIHSLEAWVAAFEGIAGLVIEGVFIAMLVQRVFLGK